MQSTLEHHDRVRGICLNGSIWFDDFFKATSFSFPALETLYLRNKGVELEIPDTFLGGSDLSNLRRLRSLTLCSVSLTSISGLLSSATSLTDLVLGLYTSFGPSAEMSLVASLQGMHCLRKLDLVFGSLSSPSQPLIPKEVVPLSKLTTFRYNGYSVFLYALVAGISAPSLQAIDIELHDSIQSPTVHLSRFIGEIEEHYHFIDVSIHSLSGFVFSFSLCIRRREHEAIWPRELRLESSFDPTRFPESMVRMSDALSVRLATLEVLVVKFDRYRADYVWEDYLPWHRFYRHLSSVKTLRITCSMARTLYQYHGEPDGLFVLSALEEIHLFDLETDESKRGTILAAFQPFVNAREQSGRPVNVFFHTG